MLSRFNPVRLLTPQAVSHHSPLSMGFSQQKHWSGLPCPPPGDLPNPGIKPRSPTLQGDSLPSEPPGKPKDTRVGSLSLLLLMLLGFKDAMGRIQSSENEIQEGEHPDRGSLDQLCQRTQCHLKWTGIKIRRQ